MGCDGGTIPKRHELVKGPRKVEKVDKVAELVARWFYCALSQEKLRRPIVACELGRLYNKDAIIEYLLDKSPDKTPMESASHIKSIKNVTELQLVDNPAWGGDKESIKGDKYDDLQCARFICPVVGLEMNGRHRFCFLRNCGCVFSERALKEIKAEVCHKDAARSLRRGLSSATQLHVEVAVLLQAPVLLDGHLSLAQHLEPQPPLQALQHQGVPPSLKFVGKQMRGLNNPLQIPQAINADVSDVMTCRDKLERCGGSRKMN
ncbi:replication termination factor 2 isoform X2 [Cinclus cinclus]|uniref:replication termination factor 2 isoform X2 n=1 Tax=Cinclus cinclus TaxID=127875 RepID=UPI002E0F79A0